MYLETNHKDILNGNFKTLKLLSIVYDNFIDSEVLCLQFLDGLFIFSQLQWNDVLRIQQRQISSFVALSGLA